MNSCSDFNSNLSDVRPMERLHRQLARLENLLKAFEGTMLVAVLGIMLLLGLAYIVVQAWASQWLTELVWSRDLLRKLFLWLVFLGAGYCAKHGRHVKIDVLSRVLSPKRKKLAEAAVAWLSFAASALVFVGCLGYVARDLFDASGVFSLRADPTIPGVAAIVFSWVFLYGPFSMMLSFARHGVETLTEIEKPWRFAGLFVLVWGVAWALPGSWAHLALFILILLSTLAGAPLFVSLFLFSMLGHWREAALDSWVSFSFTQVMIPIGEKLGSSSAEILLAIPFFTLAGTFLAQKDIPGRIVQAARAWLGWLPAGMAVASLVACAFFTAITGVSGVTIVALGGLLLPMLMLEKYPERFNLGLLTTAGSRGLLFPPSLPVILFAFIATSAARLPIRVDDLFLSGLVPALLDVVAAALFSIWLIRKKAPDALFMRGTFSFTEGLRALKNTWSELLVPVLILGVIFGGWGTAADAALVAAAWVFLAETGIRKEIQIVRDVPGLVREAMLLCGGVLIIVAAAQSLTSYFINAQTARLVADTLLGFTQNRVVFLLMLNLFLLIVGCLMDIFSAILVVAPLVCFPELLARFGIEPLHLGVIFLVNLEIGYSTPPIGLNLFISAFTFKRAVTDIYRAALPFLGVMLTLLLAITFIPAISLWWMPRTTVYIHGEDASEAKETVARCRDVVENLYRFKMLEDEDEQADADVELKTENGVVVAEWTQTGTSTPVKLYTSETPLDTEEQKTGFCRELRRRLQERYPLDDSTVSTRSISPSKKDVKTNDAETNDDLFSD